MQPCKTRWNSISKMATSVLEMRAAFDAIRISVDPTTDGLKAVMPTEEQFNTLQALCPLLKIIEEYSTAFEAEKPIIHRFLVDIHNMRTKISNLRRSAERGEDVFVHLEGDDQDAIVLVMKHFEDVFAKRQEKYGNDLTYAVAAVLNPHYKGVPLFAQKKYDRTIEHMVSTHYTTIERRMMTREERSSGFETENEDSDYPLTQADKENRERIRMMSNRHRREEFDANEVLPLRSEINHYEIMETASQNEDPLKWWAKHQKDLPLLAEMARNTLCLQVTSCSSERVFSLGGRVVNKLRSGLSHKTTEMIVFTEQNINYIPKRLHSWNLHSKVTSYLKTTVKMSQAIK